MHPSGVSGTNFEAASGAQFQLRTSEALAHFRQGGWQVTADCSTDAILNAIQGAMEASLRQAVVGPRPLTWAWLCDLIVP
eukprot:616089-Alexandrium_andersonii.AAC.1